jgi:hypothetical protein
MPRDREVAGIRCMQVLGALPDFLENTLPAASRERIEAHLRGCDWCQRFGGSYGAAITLLRRELKAPPGPPPHHHTALWQRLAVHGIVEP